MAVAIKNIKTCSVKISKAKRIRECCLAYWRVSWKLIIHGTVVIALFCIEVAIVILSVMASHCNGQPLFKSANNKTKHDLKHHQTIAVLSHSIVFIEVERNVGSRFWFVSFSAPQRFPNSQWLAQILGLDIFCFEIAAKRFDVWECSRGH